MIDAKKRQKEIELVDDMQRALNLLNLESIRICMDFRAPITFCNSLDYDNIEYNHTLWNDLGNAMDQDVNIIVLSKSSDGFQNEEEFELRLDSYEESQREIARLDRELRYALLDDEIVYGADWDMIYEDDYSYIFARIGVTAQ